MLIIPIEQKLDSNNPPVATVFLIILNCLVFFGYQSNDYTTFDKAVAYYQEAEIYQYEDQVYKEYLRQQAPEQLEEYDLLEEAEASQWILQDMEFTQYLNKHYFLKMPAADQWVEARVEVDAQISELSYLKYGLIPGDLKIISFLSTMFLHGDIGHLFGNMLFLFIYGFSLEIALGRLWYLGIYMLSGLGGSLLVCLTSPESVIPTVGASGAIFGLLGMYLGLYGLKRIKFFFTVGFYVNYFKAPALILLPYWGLIELYDQLTLQDNVAHFAHIGGLLTGFLIVYAAKNRVIKINREYVDKVDAESPFLKLYDRLLRQLEKFEIPQAKRTIEMLLKMRPDEVRLLKHQFDLWKLSKDSKEFESISKKVFTQKKLNYQDSRLFLQMAKEYQTISEGQVAWDASTRMQLFNTFLKHDYSDEAEQQLKILTDDPKAKIKLPFMLLSFANHLLSKKEHRQAQNYIKKIIEEYPESEAAAQAKHFKNIS